MGHKASECVERPRSGKKAAMKTGMDIAADDVTTDLTSHGKVRMILGLPLRRSTCLWPLPRRCSQPCGENAERFSRISASAQQ